MKPARFETSETVSMVDAAYEEMRRRILDNEWSPAGKRLSRRSRWRSA